MANVTELRTFATQKFYTDGLGRSLSSEISYVNQALLLGAIFSTGKLTTDDILLPSIAEMIETISWHKIGAAIGYFSEFDPQSESISERVAEFVQSEAAHDWAPPFRQIARRFIQSDPTLRVDELMPYNDSSALAVFQSALITAEQFREPLVANLTKYLNSSDPLETLKPIDTEQVFASFEYFDERMRTEFDSNVLLAGLLRLIEALSSMMTIFPRKLPTAESNSSRRIVGTRVMQLLSWRLDLWNSRKTEKLNALLDLFWQACRSEAERHSSEFRFSLEESSENLDSLLNAWSAWSESDQSSIITKARRNATPSSSSQQEQADSST
jgi:hypothetical protein